MKAAFQRGLIWLLKWRNALLALRGCDETLRHAMRSAGATWDHVLHLPTRRAGAAGLDESGGLLLQSRQQRWVPGIHRQEVKSLGLIMAGKNSLLPPNVKVKFLISLLLWSHHWRPLGSQHHHQMHWGVTAVPMQGPPGSTQKPQGGETRRAVLAGGLWKAHATGTACSFLILYRWKGNLAPRMKYWFLVKKIIGASYHFKYFNLSSAFCTSSHTSAVKRLLQSDKILFTRSYIFIYQGEDSQKGFWADTNAGTVRQRLWEQLV